MWIGVPSQKQDNFSFKEKLKVDVFLFSFKSFSLQVSHARFVEARFFQFFKTFRNDRFLSVFKSRLAIDCDFEFAKSKTFRE